MTGERETAPCILVVDDDASVRQTLSDVLTDEGYFVATAQNGAVALARLRAGLSPALILLDLMMPVLDGMAFCAAQAADPAIAAIPTIVVSAARDGERRTARTGVSGFLQKPFGLDKLLEMVHAFI